ncbi:ArsR/SmtB family transcription factor [Sphingobium indicum]|uniref:ArsR/SmtB family transcription factor n=1 Tax=Sphingobium indicum TaxID=332055 RepID=UPI0035E56205
MQTDMPALNFKRQAGEASSLLKAMANECRLLVLCYLAEAGELSVGELTDRVRLSQSALSQHLAKLRDEGLVATRKEAQTVFYRVCDPKAEQVLALLHQIFCPDLGRETKPSPQAGEKA